MFCIQEQDRTNGLTGPGNLKVLNLCMDQIDKEEPTNGLVMEVNRITLVIDIWLSRAIIRTLVDSLFVIVFFSL